MCCSSPARIYHTWLYSTQLYGSIRFCCLLIYHVFAFRLYPLFPLSALLCVTFFCGSPLSLLFSSILSSSHLSYSLLCSSLPDCALVHPSVLLSSALSSSLLISSFFHFALFYSVLVLYFSLLHSPPPQSTFSTQIISNLLIHNCSIPLYFAQCTLLYSAPLYSAPIMPFSFPFHSWLDDLQFGVSPNFLDKTNQFESCSKAWVPIRVHHGLIPTGFPACSCRVGGPRAMAECEKY